MGDILFASAATTTPPPPLQFISGLSAVFDCLMQTLRVITAGVFSQVITLLLGHPAINLDPRNLQRMRSY